MFSEKRLVNRWMYSDFDPLSKNLSFPHVYDCFAAVNGKNLRLYSAKTGRGCRINDFFR